MGRIIIIYRVPGGADLQWFFLLAFFFSFLPCGTVGGPPAEVGRLLPLPPNSRPRKPADLGGAGGTLPAVTDPALRVPPVPAGTIGAEPIPSAVIMPANC